MVFRHSKVPELTGVAEVWLIGIWVEAFLGTGEGEFRCTLFASLMSSAERNRWTPLGLMITYNAESGGWVLVCHGGAVVAFNSRLLGAAPI